MAKRKRKSRAKPKPRKKTGPKGPIVFKPVVEDRLRKAFAIGCNITEACLYADIDKKTFYNNCPVGSGKFLEYMLLKNKPVLRARQTVVSKLDNLDNAWRYLKNKRPKEFAERVINDTSVTIHPLKEKTKDIYKKLGLDDTNV